MNWTSEEIRRISHVDPGKFEMFTAGMVSKLDEGNCVTWGGLIALVHIDGVLVIFIISIVVMEDFAVIMTHSLALRLFALLLSPNLA